MVSALPPQKKIIIIKTMGDKGYKFGLYSEGEFLKIIAFVKREDQKIFKYGSS
jgi:hypothetical protein